VESFSEDLSANRLEIMNGTGLTIALGIAVLVGVVFGVYPQLDLDLAAVFFDPVTHVPRIEGAHWVLYVRDGASLLIGLLAAPAGLAALRKLILPRSRMLIPGRAALFVLVTLALGPGILANAFLKEHWGRARPFYVTALGGTEPFTPWWDPRGGCVTNCSFIAGEPSGAFWTLAPAALAPPQWRPLAYGAALAFGAAMGVMRMAGGAHFFTDVVFAGVLMFLLAWTFHGLIYRWRTRLTDKAVERTLALPGETLRAGVVTLARRIARRAGTRL
jgi:membrane-associated PAP2 superfamily phosphatase